MKGPARNDTNGEGCGGGLPSKAAQFLIDSKTPVVPQKDYKYWVPEVIWANYCHKDRLKKHPLRNSLAHGTGNGTGTNACLS